MAYSEAQQLIFANKYHNKRDIKGLLFQYNFFRMYVRFKPSKEFGTDSKVHLYGQEHRCTYNQCLHQRVPHILLDRVLGYKSLVDLLERGSYKGRYVNAKIYGKIPGTDSFDILHREYDRGKLIKETVNDPIFDHENKTFDLVFKQPDAADQIYSDNPLFQTLYYTVDLTKGPSGLGWLVLHEEKPSINQ